MKIPFRPRLLTLFLVFFAILAPNLPAQESENPPEPVQPTTLSELAAASDLVALVQVRDTDYFMRREIPVSGSAFLKILIPYKVDQPVDFIEVFEQGLHERECYFKYPTVFEEGRRYLVFLRRDPDKPDRFRGMPQGCALEVLVDEHNRYAVRYPADGILLTDDLGRLAAPIEFADRYAVVDEEEISPQWRNEMAQAGYLVEFTPEEASDEGIRPNWMPEPEDPHRYWLYTHGIDLSSIRRLLGTENLTRDRHQRRIPPD